MLSDCAFSGNSTTGSGGGMYNEGSSPSLLSCIFSGNSAYRNGGGMYNRYRSQPSLTNCIFSGNSTNYGGGMESLDDSRPTLFNCTFSANFATASGGGISSPQNSITKLVNCILWADAPDEICTTASEARRIISTGGTVEITYSNVQNDWPGEGNIDIDPLFADPDNGDYHLKSQAGRWEPNDGRWTMDNVTSPCIDAGDPGMPVGLERLPNSGRINMGAYGGTPEASLSSWPRLLGRASNPSPADGAVDVYYRNVKLSWTAGLNAVSHNVYFGPSIHDMFLVSMHQTATEFEFRTLELSYGTAYYWCIDEVDSGGAITSGEIWTFTTTTPPSRR
jgi:parallel beta-helix repeat protein/predicted outer membrane repeat protein